MPARPDAIEKVTGKALYADDLRFDRMLYAKQLYSEHAHAKILNIDVKGALQTPLVADVIVAENIPGLKKVGDVIQDHCVLAHEKVRYHGGVVAVVAAETSEAASQAVQKIQVEYEPLEPVFDPLKAVEPNAPLIHEDKENNITATSKVRFGNPKKIFEKNKNIFEASFQTQHIEHAYLEPESCIALKNPNGTITVYAGMQHPFTTRRYVASVLGLMLSQVRVIQTTLGGGFGGRDDTISAMCARAALLAYRTERPVKLTLTREESMRESYKRHPFHIRLKMVVDQNHKIQALESFIIADGGPYCSVSPFVIWRPTVQCTGPYKIPNVHCDSIAAYTNNTFCGAMRGFGTPQYNFAIESFMDMVAFHLGTDPIRFRENNFFQQNDKIHTGQTLSGHKVSIAQVVHESLKEFDWEKKYKNCSRAKPDENNKYHGVGMACSYRGVSLGAEGKDICTAIVNIQPDGSILLEVGVSENGQGLKAAMTRILSIELGIDPNRILFLDTDTSSITDSGPTVASRGTLVGGNAVIDAARQIKDRMIPVLEKLIGKSKTGYNFSKDKIANPRTKKEVSFSDAVMACHDQRIILYSFGVWRGPKVNWNKEKGQGDAYFTHVYGCNCVEVEVDGNTGKIKVLSSIGTHDVGRSIDSQMLKGQIYGGMVMGLGQTLLEEVIHDQGKIQNLNFNTYKIPRTLDVPEMKAQTIENPDPHGPFGAKSIGEPTNELMAGAIANAVFNATGIRVRQLPIVKEIIKFSLQNKENNEN